MVELAFFVLSLEKSKIKFTHVPRVARVFRGSLSGEILRIALVDSLAWGLGEPCFFAILFLLTFISFGGIRYWAVDEWGIL